MKGKDQFNPQLKHLEGNDIILNLKEINIMDIDCFSSSYCSGKVGFSIDCKNEYGYYEDPDFTGKIEILEVKKNRKKDNIYTLKVRFISEEE